MKEFNLHMLRRLTACVLLIGLFAQHAAAQTTGDSAREATTYLRQMLEALTSTGQLVIEQRPIGAANFMGQFYGARQFRPAWTDPRDVDDLIAGIENARGDGLSTEDFHLWGANCYSSHE